MESTSYRINPYGILERLRDFGLELLRVEKGTQ
jgi:hypothetical protein